MKLSLPPILRGELAPDALRWMAAGMAAMGLVGGLCLLAVYAGPSGPESFGLGPLLAVLAAPFAGLAGAAGLLTAADLLETARRAAATLRRMEKLVGGMAERPASAAAASATAEGMRRLAEEFAALRDVLLMDDAAKRERRQALAAADRRSRAEAVEGLVAAGDLDAAAAAIAAFASAHPEAPEPADLSRRVDEQRRKRRIEQADRLAERAEQAARTERWREAHRLASELVANYPDTPPADFARAGLETLKRNAEIEERRQLEEQFVELVSRRQWADALEVAERVLHDWPNSPQAEALRERLPRIRKQLEKAASGAGTTGVPADGPA
jgi:hypothetical protein